MKRMPLAFVRRTCIIFMLLTIFTAAVQAQQPILVHNQDTTFVLKEPTLDDIVVTADRHTPNISLDELIKASELTTSVSGLTKDLQRDLPSTIRLYTPQGIPILTKYTSNNSLTSSIPDSAISLNLREPSAKFPNPDIPIILEPNYRKRSSVSLSPLNQTLVFGSGTEQKMSANLALSHAGPPGIITNMLPELEAYNTTYSGFGALRTEISNTETEIQFHHSQSTNEYGNLLNIVEFYEDDRNTNITLNHKFSIGNKTVQAGLITQNGREFRDVEETTKRYEVINEINAISYTAAISNPKTELRANYHDFDRVYTFGPVDSVQQQRFESVVTHQQSLLEDVDLTLESRFDFKDLEPSVSGKLGIQASDNISFKLNGGRLYDAVGSEGLNNLMNSVQTSPHPWTVTYGSIGANFYFNHININADVINKNLKRGWYSKPADINGWVGRIGANGFVFRGGRNISYIKWNIEGVARDLSLDLPNRNQQVMPGPAKFEQHIVLEAGINNITYAIQMDSFIDRHMRITNDVTANLGSQHYLSIDATKRMGAVKLGLTLNNLLALSGIENHITAYQSETSGMSYVSAPPFFNLTLGIDL